MLRPLVQADKLAKSYGFHDIFKDVSFLIREGEKVALIGPNGVGKSPLEPESVIWIRNWRVWTQALRGWKRS